METRKTLRDFSLVIALLLICGFFAIVSPQFLGARNLSLLMTELSITATLALGMLLVILPGHIDLSVGSGVGLLGGIASVLVFEHRWPAPLAMGVALLIGIAIWFCMGNLVVRQRMPAFIITLGGLLIFKGLFWLVIHNSTIPIVQGGRSNLYSILTTWYLPPLFGYALAIVVIALLVFAKLRSRRARREHGFALEESEPVFLKLFLTAQLIFLFVVVTNQFRGVPLPALILGAVAFVIYVLTTHTPFGRYLYAIGGNEEAAIVSGIPVERVVVGSFCIMGAIVALTGFMQTSYSGASTTTVGDLMELDAIAACVIGGVSLKGGRGSVMGVLFGALIMASLLNGMTLLAVSPEFKFIARGVVLSLAVWMDVRLTR
ncbi:MAG: sugar ABC transporter permease [Chthoniobacterales bacterium]